MSEEKKESLPKDGKTEEELSNLLDSKIFNDWIYLSLKYFIGALEDFIAEDKKPKTENKTEDGSSEINVDLNSQEWSKDFVQQSASQFDGDFTEFLSGIDLNAQITPDILQQRLQQMAGTTYYFYCIFFIQNIISDAAQQVLQDPRQISDDTSNAISDSISQALQGLSAGAEGLQEPGLEEEIMKIFSGVSGQDNNFMPFMQGLQFSFIFYL